MQSTIGVWASFSAQIGSVFGRGVRPAIRANDTSSGCFMTSKQHPQQPHMASRSQLSYFCHRAYKQSRVALQITISIKNINAHNYSLTFHRIGHNVTQCKNMISAHCRPICNQINYSIH